MIEQQRSEEPALDAAPDRKSIRVSKLTALVASLDGAALVAPLASRAALVAPLASNRKETLLKSRPAAPTAPADPV